MPCVIDLFAGAGGLSLGATRAGFDVVSAVELEKNAISTHATNFPNSRHIQTDIMGITGEDLLKQSNLQVGELAGVIGGPPCQGFSNIGHGNVDDNRNDLFIKFFELVAELRPSFFLAENVPGIMNPKYRRIRESAFSNVNEYTLLPEIKVVASEYGAPTTRCRFFFIGYLNDGRINPFTTNDIEQMKVPSEHKTTVLQALEGLPSNTDDFLNNNDGFEKLNHAYWSQTTPHIQSDFFYERVTGMRPENVGNPSYVHRQLHEHSINGFLSSRHSETVRQRYAQLEPGQQDRISKSTRLNPNGFCPTLRAGTGPEKGSYQAVRPIHYKYPRVITPREAARLQGFPDWYELPKTIWHGFRQIGNSVSPIVAEQILTPIFQKLIL